MTLSKRQAWLQCQTALGEECVAVPLGPLAACGEDSFLPELLIHLVFRWRVLATAGSATVPLGL